MRTLIGLLAVTGMRIGEAIALDRDDLDPGTGVLIVPRRQVRQVARAAAAPHHRRRAQRRTCAAATGRHRRPDRARAADLRRPARGCSTERRQPHVPRSCVKRAGLRPRSARCRPRLHDLRHTLRGADTARLRTAPASRSGPRIAALSTYLGHVDPAATLLVSRRPPRNCWRSPPSASSGTSEARDDRARPDAAGVLHRPADRASATPARTRSPPTATRSGCCSCFASRRSRQAAVPARHRRPRRAADRRVPRPPRARPRLQRPDPQPPARRDPLAATATPPAATPSTPP